VDELRVTEFLDHASPEVADLVSGTVAAGDDARQRAVKLYYAVRDGIRYEVYGAELSRHGLKASAIIRAGSGFCVHKSLVYAAALRRAGIPSRLFYGDVRNHLASPRLRDLVGGDLFRFHALTLVYLDGTWIKSTPVFNRTLCRLYRIRPLEFDGTTDSLYHPYDVEGRRHMEFVRTHGDFPDFPYDLVVGGIREAHPKLFASQDRTTAGSLIGEADTQEMGRS
jgi:transglutaminase-like putative cysteine protease